MGLSGVVTTVLSELAGLLWPPRCGCCGSVTAVGQGALCADCGRELLAVSQRSYCQRCGQDAGPFALRGGPGGIEVCGQCGRESFGYAGLARVGSYAPPLDRLVRRLKYQARYALADMLGGWLAARLSAQPWSAGLDGLVAVPLHWRRRFGRGFNQADLLAERAAASLGRPVLDVLSRPVHRPPQALLPRSRRLANVRGAFAADRPDEVAGRRFCLIDDVCTTGATLSEAAGTLLAAGAAAVYAAVVAVAPAPSAFRPSLEDV